MTLVSDLLKPMTDWLLKRRPDVVVLVAILATMLFILVRGLPWLMTEVKSHVDSINASHEKQINQLTETFDKAHERDFKTINRLIEARGVQTSPSTDRPEWTPSSVHEVAAKRVSEQVLP